MYFSTAGTKPRHHREHRDIPVAVDLIEFSVQYSVTSKQIRRSGHACGKGDMTGKGNWIGGVKNSCER